MNPQRQKLAPLLDQLSLLATSVDYPFYAPGHKRGAGISPLLANLLGNSVFKADLPELPQLDNLFAPQGVIEEAQKLAAEAFGALKTWFLVNGSTCGIIAAIVATCGPGDKIILPRNIHTSAIAGLILSGALPIFITPEYNSTLDLLYSITPEALEATLLKHPDTKAVMVVYPTYQGICGDLEAIAQVTHQYNIPLLVDEAHGGHFAFHPHLPPTALSLGADLSIQSTHKVLGAMTQASMLHLQGKLVDRDRITRALQLTQSTSPSYLLLASLDAARQQMALQGQQLLDQTLQLANKATKALSQLPKISVLSPSFQPGFHDLDPTRLTINLKNLGITGFELDEILQANFNVTAELPLTQNLTFIISIGNQDKDIEKLLEAFENITQKPNFDLKFEEFPLTCSTQISSISPREAFFAPNITLPLEQSNGCVSAELICPYPPGIPLIMPGETITPGVICQLRTLLDQGAYITGASDVSLETIKIVKL